MRRFHPSLAFFFVVLACSSKPQSEPGPQATPSNVPPVGQSFPLSLEDAEKIFKQLPPISEEASDQKSLNLRDRSLPPPKTGEVRPLAFAPVEAQAPASQEAAPLSVLRVSPEGSAQVIKNLTIVFNQPMVALGAASEIPSGAVPATLTPMPEGRWRWVGDRMLVFEPAAQRFPMATDFQVTIPAGLTSASGVALSQPKVVSFSTPAPSLTRASPRDEQTDPLPLLCLIFDQQIDPAFVSAGLQLKAGTKTISTRLATQEEQQKDKELLKSLAELPEKTFVLVKPSEPLPLNTKIHAVLPKGRYSLEGPSLTQREEAFDFTTYGPLTVKVICNYSEAEPLCDLDSWTVQFSSNLSEDFTDDLVEVSPAPLDLEKNIYSEDAVYLSGVFEPDTTYTITLSPKLRDIFGQSLGGEKTFTLKTRSAPKSISGPSRDMIMLDPNQGQRLSFFSNGYSALSVKMYKAPLESFLTFGGDRYEAYQKPEDLVYETTLQVPLTKESIESAIDLTPGLTNGVGQRILVVSGKEPLQPNELPPIFNRWIQATKLSVDAFVDDHQVVAFVSSLTDGSGVAGAKVMLYPSKKEATTDQNGIVSIPLNDKEPDELLVASSGDDSVIVSPDGWKQLQARGEKKDDLLWYVVDDRHLYKPGETVTLKGMLRRRAAGLEGEPMYLGDTLKKVSYALSDSLGNKLSEGTAALSPTGSFRLSLSLPRTMNLGNASLEFDAGLNLNNQTYTHSFRVEEFRRPEFEVKAKSSDGPYLFGQSAEVSVSAEYYSGGGLPEAPVHWTFRASPGSFYSSENEGFSFGLEGSSLYDPEQQDKLPQIKDVEAFTDSSGKQKTTLALNASPEVDFPINFYASVNVTDVNQQQWGSGTSVTAYPGRYFVGLKSELQYPDTNQLLPIDVVVVDLDGKRIEGKDLTIKARHIVSKYTRSGWKESAVDVGSCQARSSMIPVKCTFQPTEGGMYQLETSVTDLEGKKTRTTMDVWVIGPGWSSQSEELEIRTILDKDQYKPGETAKLTIISPFDKIDGLLVMESDSIGRTLPIHSAKSFDTILLPVEEWMMPGLRLSLLLVGQTPRKGRDKLPDLSLPKRPSFALGGEHISVTIDSRILSVSVKVQKKKLNEEGEPIRVPIKDLPPGGKAEVEVGVKDYKGRPVSGAEVTIIAVDESILDLAGWGHPSPVWPMYRERWGQSDTFHSRVEILEKEDLVRIEAILDGGLGFGGLGSGGGGGSGMGYGSGKGELGGRGDEGEFEVRKNLDPLALFSENLFTNKKGIVRAPIQLPDSLTRYRIFAIAATEKTFGAGSGSVTAKLPLMVRPSPPRFLNYGDTAKVPVVVQNLKSAPMVVDVVLRASNAIVEEQGYRLNIPANDRLRVFFTVKTAAPGVARFQVAAVSSKYRDAAEVSLPVYTPATTESNALYGQLDAGAVSQPLSIPKDAAIEFGGVTLSTSSTALSSLTDAMLYLDTYPFECSEQLSSRLLGYLALRDVLVAFHAPGLPTEEALSLKLDKDLKKLLSRQDLATGGFGFWSSSDHPWPYLSIHAAQTLARAKEKGLSVPKPALDASLNFLTHIEDYLKKEHHYYSQETKDSLIAYSLYVRTLFGQRDKERAKKMIQERTLAALPLEAVGWLFSVLSDEPSSVSQIETFLSTRVTETAGEARFVVEYTEDQEYVLLTSERRVDAIILNALLDADPTNTLIPKMVASLLAHRTAGRWSSTQENAWVLLALDKYFRTFEAQEPNFTLNTWLGEAYLGAQKFQGREAGQSTLDIPMKALAELGGEPPLSLAKEGPGRLYYRLGLSYSPKNLELSAADFGFTVKRTYEAIDDPKDVVKNADGTWTIKSGARVRVKISMMTADRRAHVALVDPMPAGFEAQNATLAMVPSEEDRFPWLSWWKSTWYEHQNLRDERVEAFTTLLAPGLYEYSYIARATTPGSFVVGPTKAEEMYSPENFGRSSTEHVVIEAPSEQL